MIRTTIALMFASLLTLGAAVAHAEEPAVKLATCKDGKAMYVPEARTKRQDKGHMGACRGHGGVASWADGSPVRAKGASGTSYK